MALVHLAHANRQPLVDFVLGAHGEVDNKAAGIGDGAPLRSGVQTGVGGVRVVEGVALASVDTVGCVAGLDDLILVLDVGCESFFEVVGSVESRIGVDQFDFDQTGQVLMDVVVPLTFSVALEGAVHLMRTAPLKMAKDLLLLC